jgi:antiviral helicase SLH1
MSLSLLIVDDLHLLDDQFELAVSRLLAAAKPAEVRVVGLSSSINDPLDLGDWLGVDPLSILSFRPKNRGNALSTSIQPFTIPHSAILLKAMVKPTFDVITSSTEPSIVFVSSRAQCLTVASDLATISGAQMDVNGFLGSPPDELEGYLARLRDRSLKEPLMHGIGIFHESLASSDLALVLELFAAGILRVLIAPREACWALPLKAVNVVVMGTQYLDFSHRAGGGGARPDRQVQTYSLQEIFKMQSFALQPPPSLSSPSPSSSSSSTARFVLLCQAEHRDAYTRFLADGLPLESTLHRCTLSSDSSLRAAVQTEMKRGTIKTVQDGMDLLSHTFLARRVRSNPTYYGVGLAGETMIEREGHDGEGGDNVWREKLSRIVEFCMGDGEVEALEEEVKLSNVLAKKEKERRHVPGSAPKEE